MNARLRLGLAGAAVLMLLAAAATPAAAGPVGPVTPKVGEFAGWNEQLQPLEFSVIKGGAKTGYFHFKGVTFYSCDRHPSIGWNGWLGKRKIRHGKFSYRKPYAGPSNPNALHVVGKFKSARHVEGTFRDDRCDDTIGWKAFRLRGVAPGNP